MSSKTFSEGGGVEPPRCLCDTQLLSKQVPSPIGLSFHATELVGALGLEPRRVVGPEDLQSSPDTNYGTTPPNNIIYGIHESCYSVGANLSRSMWSRHSLHLLDMFGSTPNTSDHLPNSLLTLLGIRTPHLSTSTTAADMLISFIPY